jgi:hypothetical protein
MTNLIAYAESIAHHNWRGYCWAAQRVSAVYGNLAARWDLQRDEIDLDVAAAWTLCLLAAALKVAELDRFLRQARAAGAFHDDAQTVEVASETRQGVVYEVALDGSRCTCPGFVFRGRCKHVTARVAA